MGSVRPESGDGGIGSEPAASFFGEGIVRREFLPFRAGDFLMCGPGAMPRSITLRLFEAGGRAEGGI